MKCFDQTPEFPNKVNYVDDHNIVLGYDMEEHCCESFGHGVFAEATPEIDLSAPLTGYNISEYRFVVEKPTKLGSTDADDEDGEGETLAFRITAPNKPDLWVIIWNYHNGYYSHGFDFKDGTEVIADGEL